MKAIKVLVAEDLLSNYFNPKNADLKLEDYKAGDKAIPFVIQKKFSGAELEGLNYHQLLNFAQPIEGDAFRIICGDFVTTTDGTGIVHIAPSFGADDFKVARQNGIGSLTLVDKRGKFVPEVQDGVFLFGEEFVKEDFLNADEKAIEFEKQKTILEGAGKIK